MNKIQKLEEMCSKIGLFKKSPSMMKNDSNELGAYGYLLLNRIKSAWMARNLNKYENNYLIEAEDLKKITNLDYFSSSLVSTFSPVSLPLGIVNVFRGEAADSKLTNKLVKNASALSSQSSPLVTNLNVYYLNEKKSSQDLINHWQSERINWWSRILNTPANLAVENVAKSSDFESNIVYNCSDAFKLNIENLTFSSTLPTDIGLGANASDKTLLTSHTTSEIILETVLLDSVDFGLDESDDESKILASFGVKRKNKTCFNIDYSLAPFKVCILVASDDTAIHSIAKDLKSLFYSNRIDGVLINFVRSDDVKELNEKYDHLDLIGVPYVICWPSTVTKDGICLIRNRDTSLIEKTHLKLAFKQFKAISDSLLRF
jgi:hypothetical protein